jgi:hypothetical protein
LTRAVDPWAGLREKGSWGDQICKRYQGRASLWAPVLGGKQEEVARSQAKCKKILEKGKERARERNT